MSLIVIIYYSVSSSRPNFNNHNFFSFFSPVFFFFANGIVLEHIHNSFDVYFNRVCYPDKTKVKQIIKYFDGNLSAGYTTRALFRKPSKNHRRTSHVALFDNNIIIAIRIFVTIYYYSDMLWSSDTRR